MTKARTLADNFAADINGITAGTGITGGGTSGTVTVTNSMATAIDAKGDLVVGTGADTFSRLAVASTAGYVLTVDSAEATGLKWAAAAAGGKVLQVVYGSTSTPTSMTSTTAYADTGLSASITPSSTSSKVLILTSQTAIIYQQSLLYMGTRILRGSTSIYEPGDRGDIGFDVTGANTPYIGHRFSLMYLDSPSTTSSTTYKTQGKMAYGNTLTFQSSNNTSTIILMEIGA